MSLEREIPKQSEQHNVGNVRTPLLHNTVWRKRIIGVLIAVWAALMTAVYVYWRTESDRRSNDWTGFWIGEAMAGALLVLGIVQVFRETWE